MNLFKFLAVVVCATLTAPALAQNVVNDSIVNAIKIKELTIRKESLQKQIKIEDAKRNQIVNGITPETQEMLNDKQDSICLDLRSQLVSVELELKELVPNRTIATIVNRLNNLQQDSQSGRN